MPPRAVLDPGVLIAAAIAPSGVCAQLLRATLDGRSGLIVCPALTKELRDVLRRPKFRRCLSLAEADLFVALVERVAEHHPDPTIETTISEDPDDEYLIALARAAQRRLPGFRRRAPRRSRRAATARAATRDRPGWSRFLHVATRWGCNRGRRS